MLKDKGLGPGLGYRVPLGLHGVVRFDAHFDHILGQDGGERINIFGLQVAVGVVL